MLDDALRAVSARRLIWGCDITMETGLAKLWALEVIGISDDEMADIRWRNAARIFPEGSLPGIAAGDVGHAAHSHSGAAVT
jgi:predicted TIM-barrel fold metal-dependent hydrolase